MLLVDSPQIRSEAVRYSIELAKRLKTTLLLLVLLPFEMSDDTSGDVRSIFTLGEEARNAVREHADGIGRIGLPVEEAVRIGNPRSELIKFFAESGRFQAIVWGGRSDPTQKKHHWLAGVPDDLKSSILVPFVKRNPKDLGRPSAQMTP